MNVLIVNLAPVNQINSAIMRTLALANGFAELNHKVDFLTIPSSATHATTDRRDYHENINVILTEKSNRYESLVKQEKNNVIGGFIVNVARKIYHKLSIYDYTLDIANKLQLSILPQTEYDLIISVSDPKTSHIATKNLIKQGLKYKKWIQYWGDPMALDITNKAIYPHKVYKKIETGLIDDSDIVLYASPITLSKQKKTYPKLASRMYYIPTPYTDKVMYPLKEKNGPLKIGYFGAYNSNIRDIEPLYNSMKNLQGVAELILVGNSDLTLNDTENVTVLGRQDVSEFEKEVDLFVCILNKKGTQIPGKIYQNSATNKPILILQDGEYGLQITNYFRQFNRYMISDNEVTEIEAILSNGINKTINNLPVKEFHSKSVVESLLNNIL